MATVYRWVGGKKITKVIAQHEEVQRALDERMAFYAAKAEGILLHHRHSGDSRITTEKGKVDRYVVLDDTRGLLAALSIEYGRKAQKDHEGNVIARATRPVWALHDAFNLRHDHAPAKGGDSLSE